MLKNSMQIYNLLKILNKGKSLEGLKSIDEVYDTQVDVLDEIIYFHQNRENLINKKIEDSKSVFGDIHPINDNEHSIIVNDQLDNQGLLEQHLNENSKEPHKPEFKSTIFLKKVEQA
jgi:hypothetical protein